MSLPSVAHASFVIERRLPAVPRLVFRAWSNAAAKRRWFIGSQGFVTLEHSLDFRPGGSETNLVRSPKGIVHGFAAHYLDIVPEQRIIYAYDMRLGDRRISASLATVLFSPDGDGTRMTFTEQAAFLDGYEDDGSRLRGTEQLLDRMELDLRGDLTPQ